MNTYMITVTVMCWACRTSDCCRRTIPKIRCSTLVRPKADLEEYRYQHELFLQPHIDDLTWEAYIPTHNDTNIFSAPKDTLFDDVQCGTMEIDPTDMIVLGQHAPLKAWPWQAYIESDTHRCGGVLIAHHWVLTAGHCVKNNKFVSFGVNDLNQRTSDSRKVAVRAEFTAHVWSTDYMEDIGLIQLASPVPFNDFISPACLPRDREDFHISEFCYATGFGATFPATSRLQQMKVRVVPQKSCRYAWKLTGNPFISENQLCVDALDVHQRASMCHGDSGGPLSCLVRGKYFVIGLASFIFQGCNGTVIPNVFTRVSYYIDWIKDIIRYN